MVKLPFDLEAYFISRPNRFIVICTVGRDQVEAYLPNPGRMWELLYPGVKLALVKNAAGKTDYTVMAVWRENKWIPAHTSRTNFVTAELLKRQALPGLETARIIRAEAPYGHHRFDFLLEKEGKPFWLEVKSVTLFEDQLAMFPDAVTQRGRSHLETLAQIAAAGAQCGVAFMIHWSGARFFMPDYHTDFEFAQTFLQVRQKVAFFPFVLNWQDDLSLTEPVTTAKIPWQLLEQECRDEGDYLFILEVPEGGAWPIGKLGLLDFRPGYYLYVGSARKNLTQRLNRHLRKRKKKHWHIDYLREQATACVALPIRSSTSLEHELAAKVANLADWAVAGFGCSDCSCSSHLYGFNQHPLKRTDVIELLQFYRIGRLVEQANRS